jgi:hypothetical protein
LSEAIQLPPKEGKEESSDYRVKKRSKKEKLGQVYLSLDIFNGTITHFLSSTLRSFTASTTTGGNLRKKNTQLKWEDNEGIILK